MAQKQQLDLQPANSGRRWETMGSTGWDLLLASAWWQKSLDVAPAHDVTILIMIGFQTSKWLDSVDQNGVPSWAGSNSSNGSRNTLDWKLTAWSSQLGLSFLCVFFFTLEYLAVSFQWGNFEATIMSWQVLNFLATTRDIRSHGWWRYRHELDAVDSKRGDVSCSLYIDCYQKQNSHAKKLEYIAMTGRSTKWILQCSPTCSWFWLWPIST